MNGVASVDAMLGIINNASQTATIVDTHEM